MELIIDKMANVNFKIKWQPDKPDNYKYTIFFEVTNNARLKFLVHCYGVCTAPVVKKPIRKPCTMLQPIKREKTTVFADNKKPPAAAPAPVASRLIRKPLSKENKAAPPPPKKNGLTFEATAVPQTKKVTSKTPTLETRTLAPSQSLHNLNSKNQTFLIESIYNKVTKAPSMADIYNTSFDPEDINRVNAATNSTVIAQSSTIDEIRRQTCIIGSPKITKEGKYVSTMELDTQKEDTTLKTSLRRSISANNLTSPSNFSFDINSLTVIAGGVHEQNYGS